MAFLEEFRKKLEKVKHGLKEADEKKINLKTKKKESFIFSRRKESYFASSFDKDLNSMTEAGWKLASLLSLKENRKPVLDILTTLEDISLAYSEMNLSMIKTKIKDIENTTSKIKDVSPKRAIYDLPRSINVPGPIKDEVLADLDELRSCFSSGLFRSSVILCGRILEVALHRKYYEVTKKDILETQPGIGLGKLVAKLYEKKVLFDPGINEQIHLINKVRIHSVHKKQEVFKTTRDQTYATILYTLDIVKRLFS